MKLVCTGGRDYTDIVKVDRILNEINPKEVYVGDCPTGVDLYVRTWCRMKSIPYKVFEADWDKEGKRAGPIRNARMVAEGSAKSFTVLAFPGGKGTSDCVQRAKDLGMIVLRVL